LRLVPKALHEKVITKIILSCFLNTFVRNVPAYKIINDLVSIDVGTLILGGFIRANYVKGDYLYDGTGKLQHISNGENMEMDVFRLNADWQKEAWVGKAEYYWYNGYTFFTPHGSAILLIKTYIRPMTWMAYLILILVIISKLGSQSI